MYIYMCFKYGHAWQVVWGVLARSNLIQQHNNLKWVIAWVSISAAGQSANNNNVEVREENSY